MTTSTLQAPSAVNAYLAAFNDVESELPGGPAVQRLRRAAIARFGELGFPGPRNEDWRFTNVTPIVTTCFQLPESAEVPELSAQFPPGVRLLGLGEALATCPELVEPHLGRLADFRDQAFAALNTAFWRDGVFIHVPAGEVIEHPIIIRHAVPAGAAGAAFLRYRRCLVVLERDSQATVVEQFEGERGGDMTNAVTEIALGEGASLDHYKVQEESPHAFHVASTHAVLARSARLSTLYVGLGGSLVRNEVRVRFDGPGGEATVNGLYQAGGSQHVDNFTVIDHAQPHCTSHELYKGILDGKAHGVFNGKILVRQDAQKTDAKQTNQTLLLSADATINTKPQLEIFADDVKCTHGATVGQLSADQLFYLRARGIGAAEARALLTFAFANDVIDRVRVPSLRDRLEQRLLQSHHLPRLEPTEDNA
jgi:Fe-S cluster assembly protein SufD